MYMKLKQLRVKVLEQVVKNLARGHVDRADKLIERYLEVVGTQIVNESNWSNHDDPMFAARRELQRELEDDLERNRVDLEGNVGGEPGQVDGEQSPFEPEGSQECSGPECDDNATEVANLVSQLITAGQLDDDKLEQILAIAIGNLDPEGDPEAAPQPEGGEMVPTDEPPIHHPNPDPDAGIAIAPSGVEPPLTR